MFKKRIIKPLIKEYLSDTPVLILTGARQTGKSTLLREMFSAEAVIDLDDLGVLRAFRDNAERALDDAMAQAEGGTVVIDEVQRVPDIMIAVKRRVDAKGTTKFVLTGSANLSLLRHVNETLAGRSHQLELAPLAFSEWIGSEPKNLINILERGEDALRELKSIALQARTELDSVRDQLLEHGSMPALLEKRDSKQRARWLGGYHKTYLERDIRDVGESVEPMIFSKALELACLRTSGIVSWSDIGRDLGCSYHTAKRYLEIMRLGFQIFFLPAWSGNLTTRLVKAPRLFASDVGVRNQVAGTDQPRGAVYETWVIGEVRKLLSATESKARLSFFRSSAGLEVDLLIESEGGIIALEVKSNPKLDKKSATNLKRLRESLGDRFRIGLVIHPGYRVEEIEAGIYGIGDLLLLT